MSDYYKAVVPKPEDEEVSSGLRPQLVPKEEPIENIDVGNSAARCDRSQADTDKKNEEHDEYVAALRAITQRETDHDRKKELRREARRWIGAIIFKDVDGVKHRGNVTDYEVENGWFKIVYDDYSEEEMNKDEVIQRLAYPDLLRPYFNNLPDSSTNHHPRRTKNKLPNEKKVNAARASNAPAPIANRYPRRPRKAKQPSTYIPLAIRESKKDDYFWY